MEAGTNPNGPAARGGAPRAADVGTCPDDLATLRWAADARALAAAEVGALLALDVKVILTTPCIFH
jgi:hypothetical protein